MSSATLALIKQVVRDRGKSLLLQDENGFTPAEAAELKSRIHEVKNDDLMHQNLMSD